MSVTEVADGNEAGRGDIIFLADTGLVADPAGVLFWGEESLLVVADLHLEKGSSFARHGTFLPPYDTAATLDRLSEVISYYQPRAVIALGDSFHDGDGPGRLGDDDRDMLRALQRGRDWIWIAGNHDPDPAPRIGGIFSPAIGIGPLTFRHEPAIDTHDVEVAGHLHPMARVATRARVVSRRCFASDDRRLVMPAFGAYAGGLNVRHAAFSDVFSTLAFTALMLGDTRVFAIPAEHCLPD